jgi:hypothetical protein
MKAGETQMRKPVFFLMFLSFFLFAGCASATTYYISYSAGSNTNNGTSQSTPWKTHPYMQTASGCTGTGSAPSYSHSAGDQFIFKQGDAWPNACFDMVIQNGGASGNPDVYTFDPTWGTPGGTIGNIGQAVGTYKFNAGGSVIKGADGTNVFVLDNSSSYITFNGMELAGMTWTGDGGPYGNVEGFDLLQSTFVTISNIYAHAWTHPGATNDALSWVVGYGGSPYNVGDRVTGSVFDGANSGGPGKADSGAATFAIPLSDNNIIKNMSNGLLTNANAVIHDNLIGPINQSFESTDHENCIEPIDMYNGLTSINYIYNNIWHDCYAVGILTQGAPPTTGIEIDYLWNNVAYVGSVPNPAIPFQFDSVSLSNSGSAVHAWNNTVYGGSSTYCMRTVDRGNGNFGALDIQNNHCISDAGVISLGPGGNVYTNKNNLLMSTATAASQGYTSSETYAYSPTAASNGTVGAGTNLTSLATAATALLATDTTYNGARPGKTRPASGAWDAGAYEFSSSGVSGTPAPPTNVKVLVIQ